MGIKIITPPTEEPISRVDCWRHLRLDGAYDSPLTSHPEADMIEGFLATAREWAEKYTGRAIAPQTLELALDRFPCGEIELPRAPVQSITSVKYIDTDGNEQTISASNYVLDDYSEQHWLLPADGYNWPSTDDLVNAIKVRYVAGYSLPSESPQTHPLPKGIRSALLLLMAELYEHRENSLVGTITEELPFGVKALLNPHRINLGI